MSKRSLLFGSMAAIITVLLIFVGCSQSDDPVSAAGPDIAVGDGSIINLKNRISADELANELAHNAVVTLIGDYKELVPVWDTKDSTVVPTTLHIPTDRTLVVGENVILVFDDDHLSVDGTLKVA
ncbi:MAG: hypothetical protein LBC60_06415, partial [Spirochaetaceae bacterium]|nr:hypothetical protein [Spirochaetaceae bacterium]